VEWRLIDAQRPIGFARRDSFGAAAVGTGGIERDLIAHCPIEFVHRVSQDHGIDADSQSEIRDRRSFNRRGKLIVALVAQRDAFTIVNLIGNSAGLA
jgi:hypothetical protein